MASLRWSTVRSTRKWVVRRQRERERETAESTSKIKRYTSDGRKKTETAYRIAYRNYVVKTACFIGRKKST
jgi:hypothetical protein